jgi:hypothetical protein
VSSALITLGQGQLSGGIEIANNIAFNGTVTIAGSATSGANNIQLGNTRTTVTCGGSLTANQGLTLPATYVSPTITQLGYNNSISNTLAVSVGTLVTDILLSGSVLPLGTFLISLFITATFSASNTVMSLRFTEGTGVNITGKPANDVLVLVGHPTFGQKTSLTYTFVCMSTNTGNNGDITIKGIVPSGTGTIAASNCKMTWIKIA